MKLNKLLKLTDEELYIDVKVDKDVPDCFKTLYKGCIKDIPDDSVINDADVKHFEPSDDELKVEVYMDYASIVINIADTLKGNNNA